MPCLHKKNLSGWQKELPLYKVAQMASFSDIGHKNISRCHYGVW